MRSALSITLGVALAAALATPVVLAQNQPMPHPPVPGGGLPMPPGAMPDMERMHQKHQGPGAAGGLTMPGQDAFAAIAEVVRILDADPATDWSKVDLERLRQHLIDMNEVVQRAQVKQAPVPDGLVMEVTGIGRTEPAIRAMLVPHAALLDRMPSFKAKTELIPGGVRLTVTLKTPADHRALLRLRGLGFIGLLTLGAHHGPHHLAMARGQTSAHTH
jgi:hypothetical protein